MVISRSHINEQISKGGNKMAEGKTKYYGGSGKFKTDRQGWKKLLPGIYDKTTGEKLTKVQRKRRQERMLDKANILHGKKKKGSAYTGAEKQAGTEGLGTPPKSKKTPTTKPPILKGKPKKKVVVTPKIKKKPEVKQKPLPEIKAKKKKTRSSRHMLFGGQKVRIPGRKGGGVITQKVRKYNEGGIVVHDQSTIKNV